MLLRLFTLGLALAASQLAARATELFPFGSAWNYFVGTREASNPTDAWRATDFDDSHWSNAPAAFGVAKTGIVTRLPTSTINRFWVAMFFRKTFELSNPASVSKLIFSARVDDGCAVWINGREAGRFNLPDGDLDIYTPFEVSLPLGEVDTTLTSFTLSKDIRSLLVPGTNVVAVEAYNATFNGDFYFDGALEFTVDTTAPKVNELLPPAGTTLPSIPQIEVFFDEDVTGVDATDLLINGVAATDLTVVSDGQYVFEFPGPAPGPVQVSWRTDHQITDLAVPPNAFEGGSWSYTIDPNVTPPGVIISEFMANNNKGLRDDDGDRTDWLELFNSGYVTAKLDGYFLTAKTDDLKQWRLPAVSLLPQQYLLIFASGKNRTNVAAPLHTNFKLSKDGGYLALVNPAGEVVSEFAGYPPQRADVSYGRDRTNPEMVGFFTSPTPGAPNATTGAGFASEVQFSVPSSCWSTPFSLALSTVASQAVIHYAFGTNLPTESSPAYTGPIAITNTTWVRARAFVPGLLPGPVWSESYFQLAPGVASFSSDLPVIVLHNLGGGEVPASEDQFVAIQVFEPKSGAMSFSNFPDVASPGVFHKRGRSTGGLPKASFFLEFDDEYGADKNVSVGGLPSESDWVLYAPNSFEPVLIHNPVAHELMRQMGQYSPRTRFVEVYLQDGRGAPGAITPAEYNGVYVLEEKIKIGKNRVDIDKLQPEQVNPPQVTGGYLLSIDSAPPGSRPFYGAGAIINNLDPSSADIATPQQVAQLRYITGFFDEFDQALNGPNWTNAADGYAAYIDVPAAINHHLQGVITFNVDALRLSGYFYKPRDGKLTMGPVWDFDRTQGSTDGRDFNPRLWRSTVPDYGTDMFNSDPIFNNPWYSRMFQDLEFWQKWIDRYEQLRPDVLSTTNVYAIIDRMADEVRQAQPREVARWRGSAGSSTSPRNGQRSSGGFNYTFPGTYQGEVDFMKVWYSNRLDFLDGQLVPAPKLDLPGGAIAAGRTVTIAVPDGATAYYTLDGSDPRLPGGAVSPGSQAYAGPITIQSNVRLVARAQNPSHKNLTGSGKPPLSSTWSGPVAATYVVSTPSLVISKIMYDPPDSSPGAGDGASFEYLEFANVGSTPLNLGGFRLTRGVEFTFPALMLEPEQHVVVVQNLAAFQSRYGTNALVAGTYTGQLDNAGERITLEGPLQEPILDFTYDPQWFPITRGLGFALENANVTAPPDAWEDPTNWRAAGSLTGRPGEADPPRPPFPKIVVNEAISHSAPPLEDLIELYNAGSTAADISGWYLSDDFSQPLKFRIGDNTILNAGEYRVYKEAQFNSGPGAFALSANGDDVYLFSVDTATNLTGYVHGFAFGAADEGVSFGRYVTSTGEEQFVPQVASSFGQTNAGPQVGPLVINEIMFAPPPLPGVPENTRDEFLELRNVSGQPLPLFNALSPAGTWALDGAVQFQFPTNLTIAPDEYVLVVGFDPMKSPTELAGFQAQYQISSNAVILGPWSGRLQNSGETIRLYKPAAESASASTNNIEPSQVLIEEIQYFDSTPWPSDGRATGKSLQRINSNAYGNDPINWITAFPTPLQGNAAPLIDSDGDGLPDSWELADGLDPHDATGDNGALGDPDGDGFTNVQEYLSGTSPRSAESRLEIKGIANVGTGLRLRFNAAAHHSYSVLVRTNVNAVPWIKLMDIPASAAAKDVDMEIGDPAAEAFSQRYYRLVTPAQP